MPFRQTTLERAFDLARSGQCATVHHIKTRLKAEGYADVNGQLYGPSVRAALRDLCNQAEAERATEESA